MKAVPQSLVSETLNGESTSLSLLENARNGDNEAWNRFVEVYTPLVYSNLRRLRLSETDAADVSQEVFAKLVNKLDKFDATHPKATFRGWLATVVKNACISHFRIENKSVKATGGTDMHQMLHQAPDEFDDELLDDEDFLRTPSDDEMLIKKAIEVIKNDFEESTWNAFWMTAIEEKPSSEVAEELGKSNAAIRKSKQRVMDRLKETLADVFRIPVPPEDK